MRIKDLTEKVETIRSATKASGEIDRIKANKMVDPKGYFSKNKSAFKISKRTPKI